MRNYLIDIYWLMRSKIFDSLSLAHRLFYEYSNIRFAAADRYLRLQSRHESVWKQYKRFFKGTCYPGAGYASKERAYPNKAHRDAKSQKEALNDNEFAPYGETPLLTMRRLVKRFAIESNQCVLDLGFGSGRVAFWLATQVGCRVIGVEQVSSFVHHAKEAAKLAGMGEDELLFIEGDLLQAPFEQVDIVYFYGLGFSDHLYDSLILKIASLDSPPWVITIGGPLSEYSSRFNVIQQTPVVFPWGWTTAYLNVYVP